MVLDTACARLCGGAKELIRIDKKLTSNGFPKMAQTKELEPFKFGDGPKHISLRKHIFKGGICGVPLILGISGLNADIPILCSDTVMQLLDCQIDTVTGTASFLTVRLRCTA